MIGAFINISAVSEWLAAQRKNVVVLCSGWKNRFCLEDALFAGHSRDDCWTPARSDPIAIPPTLRWTWEPAESDVLDYVEKAAQRHRLKRLGLDEVIPYSFACDLVDIVPVFDGNAIKALV